MSSTKNQKRFNIALIAAAIWWVIAAATRKLMIGFLSAEGGEDADLFVVILSYVMIIEIVSAALAVITVVLRYRSVELGAPFTVITSVALLLHPIVGTVLGAIGLLVIRKDDARWARSLEARAPDSAPRRTNARAELSGGHLQ